MTHPPNLKGRYDGKVLSPFQRGLLLAIGFVFLMAFQINQRLTASFKIEFFDHEIVRVENFDRETPALRPRVWQSLETTRCFELMFIAPPRDVLVKP